MRIVSLLPSATEIVCALDAGPSLVGISHECDYPAAISDRPVLTRSRIDASGSSAAIDAAVRAVIRDAISIYSVDDAKLAALKPDVIVTQDLCEVCAVSLDDVRAAVARLAHREDVRIVSLRPTRLEHVLADIESVAAAIGRETIGSVVRAQLAQRIRRISERAAQATAGHSPAQHEQVGARVLHRLPGDILRSVVEHALDTAHGGGDEPWRVTVNFPAL